MRSDTQRRPKYRKHPSPAALEEAKRVLDREAQKALDEELRELVATERKAA